MVCRFNGEVQIYKRQEILVTLRDHRSNRQKLAGISVLAMLISLMFIFSTKGFADDIEIAEKFYWDEQYESALPIFLQYGTPGLISPAGDSKAQFYLGELFHFGGAVTQSYAEARRWYTLSAEQGDPDATYSIGYFYEHGMGVEKSLDSAIEWYQLSVELGLSEASSDIARIYLYDKAGHKDAGFAMLKETAELGSRSGQYYLGVAYYNGEVIERDLQLSLKYLRMAEDQGESDALDLISWIFDEDEFQRSYLEYISEMRLSLADERAFKCENFTWEVALNLRETSDETGNKKLEEFAEKALERVQTFGKTLKGRIYDSGYDRSQSFREIDRWFANMFEADNEELLSRYERSPESFTSAELALLIRLSNLMSISEIVFHPSFAEYFDSIQYNLEAIWEDCISEYMPTVSGSSDISLDALSEAIGEEEVSQPPLSTISSYGKRALRSIQELSACEGDFDTAGGVAIGTLATSVVAGESAVVIISSAGILVATAPAVAVGITAMAFVGSVAYLTAKGYCFFKG